MKTLLDQSIEKSRAGVYQDTSENRRKHRVGQHYGEAKKPEEEGGEKKSKREQRMDRLVAYKSALISINTAIAQDAVPEKNKAKVEEMKATLEGKIAKLEKKLGIDKDHPDGKKPKEAPKTEPKAEPKKEEPKKEDKILGPTYRGKDGVSVEDMARDKEPEFVKRGRIDPTSNENWEAESDAIDWDSVDLAAMGQTIEYLGKIGQFEDGRDMYGIRYYSPNGKKSSVVALIKEDYLRNVERAGFNVKESMETAIDYIDPDAASLTRNVAKMVLEKKTPAEIDDFVSAKGYEKKTKDRIIRRGYQEAEAATIRMENEVKGIKVPKVEFEESDPIPESVKQLNSHSDWEKIHEEVAKYLGYEPDPNSYWAVPNDKIREVQNFMGYDPWRRGKRPSKSSVIEKLKDSYTAAQKNANNNRAIDAVKTYLMSQKGHDRVVAYKEKRDRYFDQYKSVVSTAADNIKKACESQGISIGKVDVQSNGRANLFIKGNGSYRDAEVYYERSYESDELEYKVQTIAYGSVTPGSPEAKAIALQGALVSNEALIESLKENILSVTKADEEFDRKLDLLGVEFSDLFVDGKRDTFGTSAGPLREAIAML